MDLKWTNFWPIFDLFLTNFRPIVDQFLTNFRLIFTVFYHLLAIFWPFLNIFWSMFNHFLAIILPLFDPNIEQKWAWNKPKMNPNLGRAIQNMRIFCTRNEFFCVLKNPSQQLRFWTFLTPEEALKLLKINRYLKEIDL